MTGGTTYYIRRVIAFYLLSLLNRSLWSKQLNCFCIHMLDGVTCNTMSKASSCVPGGIDGPHFPQLLSSTFPIIQHPSIYVHGAAAYISTWTAFYRNGITWLMRRASLQPHTPRVLVHGGWAKSGRVNRPDPTRTRRPRHHPLIL